MSRELARGRPTASKLGTFRGCCIMRIEGLSGRGTVNGSPTTVASLEVRHVARPEPNTHRGSSVPTTLADLWRLLDGILYLIRNVAVMVPHTSTRQYGTIYGNIFPSLGRIPRAILYHRQGPKTVALISALERP